MAPGGRSQALSIRRPGQRPDMTGMTLNCKVDFARCGIANLHASICISQGQACAIGRPGYCKDTGSALRDQERGSQRDMYHLTRGDCWEVTGGAGSQEQDEPA